MKNSFIDEKSEKSSHQKLRNSEGKTALRSHISSAINHYRISKKTSDEKAKEEHFREALNLASDLSEKFFALNLSISSSLGERENKLSDGALNKAQQTSEILRALVGSYKSSTFGEETDPEAFATFIDILEKNRTLIADAADEEESLVAEFDIIASSKKQDTSVEKSEEEESEINDISTSKMLEHAIKLLELKTVGRLQLDKSTLPKNALNIKLAANQIKRLSQLKPVQLQDMIFEGLELDFTDSKKEDAGFLLKNMSRANFISCRLILDLEWVVDGLKEEEVRKILSTLATLKISGKSDLTHLKLSGIFRLKKGINILGNDVLGLDEEHIAPKAEVAIKEMLDNF
ncbi:MAG: hypothetical protein KGP29_05135 [Proteobacteria bacterium]|nr:hypothetical protein [Pseudomonadota bacterium]